MNMPAVKAKWGDGFSQRIQNQRIHNSSDIYPEDRYRERMIRNLAVNPEVMDETFELIDRECR